MPRVFSEDERASIRETLLEKGREQFIRFGIRKANVEEIARAAGISKGSFYNFFSSKEVLYMEIREAEEDALKERFVRDVFAEGPVTRDTLQRFLIGILHAMEHSPFLAVLMNPSELEYMLRKVPREWMEEHQKEDAAFLAKLVGFWQEKGWVRRDIESEKIVGLISALVAIPILHEQLPLPSYEATLELLTGIVADGLIEKGNDR